jgi:hypothetical protein|tara:strand:+ start:1739 stop:2071 length:333 start_codon:yes stop_codon:yes gene_type:complete
MGVVGKAFAIVMLPLGILIILEAMGIYSLNIFFDKVFIGAILIIALQLSTLFFAKKYHGSITAMSIVTLIVFAIPAVLYIFSGLFGGFLIEFLPLIIGTVMIVDTIYALH